MVIGPKTRSIHGATVLDFTPVQLILSAGAQSYRPSSVFGRVKAGFGHDIPRAWLMSEPVINERGSAFDP